MTNTNKNIDKMVENEPLQIYAVYVYYPYIEYPKLDSLWYDEEDAEKRLSFISKHNSSCEPRIEFEWVG